jgi:hypothetical protein
MRNRDRSFVASALLLALSFSVLAGCTTAGVRSEAVSPAQGAVAPPLGVSYYLPMRYAKVTFTRVKADEKADTALAEAITARKEAETKDAGARAAAKAQASLLEAMKKHGIKEADAPYIAALAELVKLRQAEVAAVAVLASAKAKEGQAEVAAQQLADSKAMCGWADSVQVQLLDMVPDPSTRYLLKPQSSAFRSDTFDMTTTASGLLQTADIEQKDETGEVLINLARSIASLQTASGAPNVTEAYFQKNTEKTKPTSRCNQLAWEPRKLDFVIDPVNPDDWTRVSVGISAAAKVGGLGGAGPEEFPYTLSLAERPRALVSGGGSLATANSGTGIYYRRERPLVVDIDLEKQRVGNVILMVPNGAPVDALDMAATSFVTNKSTLGFSNGMLVKVHQTRPSPALAIVSVPWKISEAILTQIGHLLTLRIDVTRNEKTLATEEAALLQQLKEIVEAQEALDTAREEAIPE